MSRFLIDLMLCFFFFFLLQTNDEQILVSQTGSALRVTRLLSAELCKTHQDPRSIFGGGMDFGLCQQILSLSVHTVGTVITGIGTPACPV